MAQIQRHQGDYVGSEATAVEALPFIETPINIPMENGTSIINLVIIIYTH
jgi:hypothetical protein